MRVVVLAGGFGGAKMAHGFALEAARRAAGGSAEPIELSVIGNTADDLEVHGLHVSPDLDTLMYTLAGLANPETGWGVRDETWSAAAMLARYGEPTWFRLGDRDLATHIVRSARLRAGERLTDVTLGLARSLGLDVELLPMSDQRVATKVRTDGGWLDFQDYFVRRRHADEVLELRFEGMADARPTPEVMSALRAADLLIVAPSNPFVSIGPVMGLRGVADALRTARARIVAISPLVGGSALRGPADAMLRSLAGGEGAAGVARHYAKEYPGVVDDFVLDVSDAPALDEVSATGLRALVGPIVMRADEDRRALAAWLLESG